MKYDFQTVRKRILILIFMYRRLKAKGLLTAETGDFLVDCIVDLEARIATEQNKMTPPTGRHLVIRMLNKNIPIIPRVIEDDKQVPGTTPDYGKSKFDWCVSVICDADTAILFPELRVLRGLFTPHELKLEFIIFGGRFDVEHKVAVHQSELYPLYRRI